MHKLTSLSVICLCVFPVIIAQSQTINTSKWKVYEYPNPIYQRRECGRLSGAKSFICDPDSLISVSDADEIQKILQTTYEKTTCPCAACRDKQTGYVMEVALMQGMDRIINNGDDMDSRLHDARVYSYYLSLYWNFTTCDENVLILYSKDDDITYTMTWKAAREILTDDIVKTQTMATRHYFKSRDPKELGLGLKRLVQSYSDAFMRNAENRQKRSPRESSIKKLHQDEPLPVL